MNIQDTHKKWKAMVYIFLNAAKKVLGEITKSKNNRYGNKEIVKLSEKQKKMRCQIDSTRNKKLKAKKRKEQNKTLNELKKTDKEEGKGLW